MSQTEAQCLTFLQSRQSLVLSTQSESGELESSVVPFVSLESGVFAILVSELAQHTQNLLTLVDSKKASESSNPKSAGLVAGLLLADESATEQIFARERVTLQLKPELIGLKNAQRADVLTLMQRQFGDVIEVLAGLPDFHCFTLTVHSGRYVKGFGAAYEFLTCPCQALKPIKGR